MCRNEKNNIREESGRLIHLPDSQGGGVCNPLVPPVGHEAPWGQRVLHLLPPLWGVVEYDKRRLGNGIQASSQGREKRGIRISVRVRVRREVSQSDDVDTVGNV